MDARPPAIDKREAESSAAPRLSVGLISSSFSAEQGRLVTVSGVSGAGKSYLVARAHERDPKVTIHLKDSTRPQRPRDTDGDVRAISPAEFTCREQVGDYVAHFHRNGAAYGICRDQVLRAFAQGSQHCVVVNDMATVASLRLQFAGQVTSVLLVLDLDIARARLQARGTEGVTPRAAGLAHEAAEYVAARALFDGVIENGRPGPAALEEFLELLRQPPGLAMAFDWPASVEPVAIEDSRLVGQFAKGTS